MSMAPGMSAGIPYPPGWVETGGIPSGAMCGRCFTVFLGIWPSLSGRRRGDVVMLGGRLYGSIPPPSVRFGWQLLRYRRRAYLFLLGQDHNALDRLPAAGQVHLLRHFPFNAV